MARQRTDRDGARTDDPDAIRAAMAETRAALTHKLEALRERVLGPGETAPNQGEPVMAVKKKGGGAAKKAVAKKATGGAKAKAKTKKAVGKKTASAASRKTAGKKAAVSRTATTRKAAKPSKAVSKKPKTRKKSTASKVVSKAKEKGVEVLLGAAMGAVKGAAQTIVGQPPELVPAAPAPAPASSASTSTDDDAPSTTSSGSTSSWGTW